MFVLAVSVQTGAYRLSQSRSLGSFRHPALSPSASPLMVLLEPEILEPGKSSKTPTIADECVGDRTVTAQSYREPAQAARMQQRARRAAHDDRGEWERGFRRR